MRRQLNHVKDLTGHFTVCSVTQKKRHIYFATACMKSFHAAWHLCLRRAMVEGPGATRNGRKVQAAVGCIVETIDVPADDESKTQTNLRGCHLIEAFTVGKELFLVFSSASTGENNDDAEEMALRLHFGMNGCLYVGKKINVPPWKQNKEASVRIIFKAKSKVISASDEQKITAFYGGNNNIQVGNTNNTRAAEPGIIVEARESTVSGIVSANAARIKFGRLQSRDSCSPSFDARQVFGAIRGAGASNPSLMICDAILNQDLYPGVGNIIKVEGLHRAKVDPRRMVSSLKDDELRRVILHCRRYSMGWLDQGRAPEKMVYNMTTCGTCRNVGSVSMQKMGGGPVNASGSNHAYTSRTTFWCRICQPSSCSNAASSNQIQQQNSTRSEAALRPTIACPEHGSCLLRRVRKADSPNVSRIFRICKVRQCQFFAWADGHFPSCNCGKKAILRVSKTERSGGRWFLACAQGDKRSATSKQGCGLFIWAKPEILLPFGSSLTPLL